MKKFWFYAVCLFVLVAIGMPTFLNEQHKDFEGTFTVSAPWLMDQDQRDLIQPQVTDVLVKLNTQSIIARHTTCKAGDGGCVQQKLDSVMDAKHAFEEANSLAKYFNFDTTVPALCADGSNPMKAPGGYISNSSCKDGSTPQ